MRDYREEVQDDEEGFLRDERVLISDISHTIQQVTIHLPAAKQLSNFGRPVDLRPRCLASDPLCQLPIALHHSLQVSQTKTSKTPSASSVPPENVVKRVYNGRGKTLYDFFEAPDSFKCVYRKSVDNRQVNEQLYDYTANTKILELTNDYDPKLYCPLQPYQPSPRQQHQQQHQQQQSLRFSSNFQSGNLNSAFLSLRTSLSCTSQYFLLLSNDTNTHGYTHWFFFRVTSVKPQTCTFHIVNMTKRLSMYRQGMKVSVFTNNGWSKGGEEITYTNTRIERTTKENQMYYALAWNYTFGEEGETVYFALNRPYTVTRLNGFLGSVETVFRGNNINMVRRNVGYSLANNPLQSLQITDDSPTQKKVLLILARQHPGETVGSFVAEGLIESLSNPTPQTLFLTKTFRIIILPMLNPDGVIYGHSRCNLSGLDLNRQWQAQCVRELTPETFAVRRYILQLQEEYGVEVMIDLHGHSKKQIKVYNRMNSFFYACRKENRCVMRLLSYAMGKLEENFDMYSCTYGMTRDKNNTARNQLFQLGINSYTLQNSYYGKDRNGIRQHYSQSDLKSIGGSLLKALFVLYSDKCIEKEKEKEKEPSQLNRQLLLEQLEANLQRFEFEENKNRNDSGSESDPDGDLLALEERVRTIKVRDLGRRAKLLKSFAGVAGKNKKYMSLAMRKKLEERQFQTKSVAKKRSNQKPSAKVKTQSAISTQQPTKPSRTSLLLAKKFQRATRTLTEALKPASKPLTSFKVQTPIRTRQPIKQLSSRNSQPKPKRLLYQHPARRKPTRQPLKLTRQDTTTIIQKKAEGSHRRFMTELDAIRLKLNNDQLFKSCEFINTEKSLEETDFIKIESLYAKRQRSPIYNSPPQQQISRKVSRSKKKFKVENTEPMTFAPKFRKFEDFLSGLEAYSNAKSRGYTGLSDSNSVFYHFPLL